jgi:mono/diheme cytochrome c family protein
MKPAACRLAAATALIGVALVAPGLAETADVFAFIPLGGHSLLARIFEAKPPATEIRAILSAKHSRDEWVADLKGRSKAMPALQKLDDTELLTLADYLSFNMPLPEGQVPADPARANWDKTLPLDGRDFMLERCQGCHIITVVVTQKRSKEAWLGTMNKPSHVRIKLTRDQREALASYLVINAGIPVDQIPEELRAGGASY